MKTNLLLNETKDYDSGGEFTSKEILGQPDLWLKVFESVKSQSSEITKYIDGLKEKQNLHVILTGAGTSAFIGEVLESIFQRKTGLITKAVATTDLVTHPEYYFQEDKEVVLISFARSGDSPESAKAVDLANQNSKCCYNIIITCNKESNLISSINNEKDLVFILPPESNDKGLAMTGSFTSMLLAGILMADIKNIDNKSEEIGTLSHYAKSIFDKYSNKLSETADLDFDRAIFLGSGIMKGIAQESHLKLQELTDGNVICKYDSFLGFRHGPKAVVNSKSLLVYLFSNNHYANRYEVDLVNTASTGRSPIFRIGVMENEIKNVELDLKIILGSGEKKISEEFLTVVSVLPAQMLGFYKSLNLGLTPDNPSKSGMIHRVVQGVKIYPYEKNRV